MTSMRSPVDTGCCGLSSRYSRPETGCACATVQTAASMIPSAIPSKPLMGPPFAASLPRLFLLSRGVDQGVDGVEQVLAGINRITAVNRHGRRAVDLVGDGELRGALRLALYAEGFLDVVEFLRVDAVLAQPLGERLGVVGAQPVAVDRVEERAMQLVEHAERLEGVEDGAVVRHLPVDHPPHAAPLHVR